MDIVIGLTAISVAILIGLGALGVGIALFFTFANPFVGALQAAGGG